MEVSNADLSSHTLSNPTYTDDQIQDPGTMDVDMEIDLGVDPAEDVIEEERMHIVRAIHRSAAFQLFYAAHKPSRNPLLKPWRYRKLSTKTPTDRIL